MYVILVYDIHQKRVGKAKHRAGSPLSYPLFCRSIRLQPRLLPFRVYQKNKNKNNYQY